MDKGNKICRENFNWLFEQPLNIQMEVMNNHLAICQLIVNNILQEEVKFHCGERYEHDQSRSSSYDRYGYNPGSVNINGKKLKVEVPRIIDQQTKEFKPLETYKELKKLEGFDEQTMEGVLHGLSTRDYKKVVDYLEEGFGLSKSSVSRKFIHASEEALKEFQSRTLSEEEIVSIFIDGKHLAKQQMIIALGITITGEKRLLGFTQTSTENSIAIGQMLQELIDRGLQYKDGILFVLDGSKGMRKAVEDKFGNYALIQRCAWHKLENVLSYLSDTLHVEIKKKFHQCLNKDNYKEALEAFKDLGSYLKKINLSACNSLLEGLEEILTLHKLNMSEEFKRSFQTTNCIESINSQIKKFTGRVTHWTTSEQRYRWLAAALLEIETRLKKVHNFKNIKKLRKAIQFNLNLHQQPS